MESSKEKLSIPVQRGIIVAYLNKHFSFEDPVSVKQFDRVLECCTTIKYIRPLTFSSVIEI